MTESEAGGADPTKPKRSRQTQISQSAEEAARIFFSLSIFINTPADEIYQGVLKKLKISCCNLGRINLHITVSCFSSTAGLFREQLCTGEEKRDSLQHQTLI